MEGILYKWTNYLIMWKPRYFVLTGHVLAYYVNKGEKPRGRIHLAIASLNPGEDDVKFEIDTGLCIMYLKAENKEEKVKWIRELKRAKFEADKSGNMGPKHISTPSKSLVLNTPEANSDFSLLKALNYVIGIQNDVKINNSQIKYLTEDCQLNKEEYINTIIKLTESNEDKLDQLGVTVEELKCLLEAFQIQFNQLQKFFGGNSDISKGMNAYGDIQHIGKKVSPSTNSNVVNGHENNIEFIEVNADINGIRENIEKSKSKFKPEIEAEKVKTVIGKDKEVFYEIEDEEGENTPGNTQAKFNNNTEICLPIPSSPIKTNQLYFDKAYISKRFSLPVIRKKSDFSIWGILKDALGKDLNKFAVPVYFNEPLSMLQRLCENFQYASLLSSAAEEPSPFLRLAYVGAFCISGFSLDPKRTLKFFNPLLGETYEYIDNSLNFRYFAEQVSHHPAISACYVEGLGYTFYANTNLESNFKLMKATLEFIPISKSYITFTRFNEQISFSKPTAAARNIISNVYVDCYGKFNVTNHNTGDYAEFEAFEASGKEQGKLKGQVKNMYGDVQLIVEGNWLSHIDVINPNTNENQTIWKKTPIEGDAEARFFFTDYTINLNNLNKELEEILPRSDSRFRPDQRALENQDLDLATKEKHRLEERQRIRRKEMEKEKKKWSPLYFNETYDDWSGELVYQYTRDYWKDRKEKNLSHFPKIF